MNLFVYLVCFQYKTVLIPPTDYLKTSLTNMIDFNETDAGNATNTGKPSM